MFLQDHRENGQLQPGHPGDSTSLRSLCGDKGLHCQPAHPLKLHQRGHHPSGEERPAAANTATGLTWSADHYDSLHKLVCAILYSFIHATCKSTLKNKLIQTDSFIYIMYHVQQLQCNHTTTTTNIHHPVFSLPLSVISQLRKCFLPSTGTWRLSYVKPAMPSLSTVPQCTALWARLLTASQVSEQRSSQIYQVALFFNLFCNRYVDMNCTILHLGSTGSFFCVATCWLWRFHGFPPTEQRCVVGHYKLAVGVKVCVNVGVFTCRPCDRLASCQWCYPACFPMHIRSGSSHCDPA